MHTRCVESLQPFENCVCSTELVKLKQGESFGFCKVSGGEVEAMVFELW